MWIFDKKPFPTVSALVLEKVSFNRYKLQLLNDEVQVLETSKDLPVNSVVSLKVEKSGEFAFHKVKVDEDWKELTRNKNSFFISEGSPKGMPPSCIGCRFHVFQIYVTNRKTFTNRSEKRLQTYGYLSTRLDTNEAELEIPRRVKLNMCISQTCLETGMKRMASKFKFQFNTQNLSKIWSDGNWLNNIS